MNLTVEFEVAPDAAEWAAVLAEDGWKVTRLTAHGLSAEMVRGNAATHPPRQELRWCLEVQENASEGMTVSIEVPAFTDSIFAKQRLLDTIKKYADQVDGRYETSTSFDLRLINRLKK